MKKALRLALSMILLSGLALSQIPSVANCQMVYGSYFAKSCALPCCKTNLPMPRCPFLKASAPRDFISTSAPTFNSAPQSVHAVDLIQLPIQRPMSSALGHFTQVILRLFSGPPSKVRAPPSDSHLQDA